MDDVTPQPDGSPALTPAAALRPPLTGRRFFCSWSGGKDAYLALTRAVAQGGQAAALLCMLHEDGAVSRGHGLPLELLQRQADALGLPLIARATTWDGYEAAYIAALHELRESGVQAGVFGDIDLQPHRDWVEMVCAAAGLSCHLPLWQEPRRRLVDELLASGVRATVVAVDAARLAPAFAGRAFDAGFVNDVEAAGADACGEEGEFHTMVTDAPGFAAPVALAWHGVVSRDDHWILDFTTDQQASKGAQKS
jgi:diphthine-ammonia ligase